MYKPTLLKFLFCVSGVVFIGFISNQMWNQSLNQTIHSQVLQGLMDADPVYPQKI